MRSLFRFMLLALSLTALSCGDHAPTEPVTTTPEYSIVSSKLDHLARYQN